MYVGNWSKMWKVLSNVNSIQAIENLGFSIGNGFGIDIQLWRLSFAQYKSNLELGVSSIFFVKHVLFELEAWNFVRNF